MHVYKIPEKEKKKKPWVLYKKQIHSKSLPALPSVFSSFWWNADFISSLFLSESTCILPAG